MTTCGASRATRRRSARARARSSPTPRRSSWRLRCRFWLWTPTTFATELAAERESKPGDDLMTALVQAEIDGERLTHAEIAAFFVLLSVAGNDTTRHTTSHAMRALTVNPGQRALLMQNLD